MSFKVYIDGKLYDKEDAKISVYDHGLLYGDGVFEGIRSYGGNVFRLRRPPRPALGLGQGHPLDDPHRKAEMARPSSETLAVNGITDGYIRVVVTRGVGTLGLDPNRCSNPQVIIITDTSASIPRSSTARAGDRHRRARCGTIPPRSARGSSRSTT